MRWSLVLVCTLGCSSRPAPIPPKPPNTELVVGEFERRPPVGTQAIRFEPGGTFRIAKTRAELERSPHLADGTYKVDGDQVTLLAEQGECSERVEEREGVYKVVISKIGIRWIKVSDDCEARARMDGQTWWRIR